MVPALEDSCFGVHELDQRRGGRTLGVLSLHAETVPMKSLQAHMPPLRTLKTSTHYGP